MRNMVTQILQRLKENLNSVQANEMDEVGNAPFESHGITSCHRKEIEF
jgi:3-methyladenine DNA glycosylase AlkD